MCCGFRSDGILSRDIPGSERARRILSLLGRPTLVEPARTA
jgi:hypothetical protein